MNVYYIAGKITGNTNYVQDFKDAENKIRAKIDKEHDVLFNPVEECLNENKTIWLDCLSYCKALIDLSETVIVLPNWKDSRGACAEVEYALYCNKTVIELGEFLGE